MAFTNSLGGGSASNSKSVGNRNSQTAVVTKFRAKRAGSASGSARYFLSATMMSLAKSRHAPPPDQDAGILPFSRGPTGCPTPKGEIVLDARAAEQAARSRGWSAGVDVHCERVLEQGMDSAKGLKPEPSADEREAALRNGVKAGASEDASSG